MLVPISLARSCLWWPLFQETKVPCTRSFSVGIQFHWKLSNENAIFRCEIRRLFCRYLCWKSKKIFLKIGHLPDFNGFISDSFWIDTIWRIWPFSHGVLLHGYSPARVFGSKRVNTQNGPFPLLKSWFKNFWGTHLEEKAFKNDRIRRIKSVIECALGWSLSGSQ